MGFEGRLTRRSESRPHRSGDVRKELDGLQTEDPRANSPDLLQRGKSIPIAAGHLSPRNIGASRGSANEKQALLDLYLRFLTRIDDLPVVVLRGMAGRRPNHKKHSCPKPPDRPCQRSTWREQRVTEAWSDFSGRQSAAWDGQADLQPALNHNSVASFGSFVKSPQAFARSRDGRLGRDRAKLQPDSPSLLWNRRDHGSDPTGSGR